MYSVQLLIGGNRFRFWSELSLKRSIDSFDSVSFSAPFSHENAEFRALFKPFSYEEVQIIISDEVIFTGVMVTVIPSLQNKQRTITVECYAKSAVLNDCCLPADLSSDKLEFNKQKLGAIAETIAGYFDLKSNIVDDGAAFERIATTPEKTALSFLVNIAGQRNLIITNDESGNLKLHKAIDSGSPVAILSQGLSPVLSVSPQFNAQSYYSEITGFEPVKVGKTGAKYTATNQHLSKIRPHSYSVNDAEGGEVSDAVNSKMGRMFGGIVSYSVNVSTWDDGNGKLWQPNTIIQLLAPDAMIYKAYDFVLRSVEFSSDNSSQTAVLNLVLKGSYSGKTPEDLPWD